MNYFCWLSGPTFIAITYVYIFCKESFFVSFIEEKKLPIITLTWYFRVYNWSSYTNAPIYSECKILFDLWNSQPGNSFLWHESKVFILERLIENRHSESRYDSIARWTHKPPSIKTEYNWMQFLLFPRKRPSLLPFILLLLHVEYVSFLFFVEEYLHTFPTLLFHLNF